MNILPDFEFSKEQNAETLRIIEQIKEKCGHLTNQIVLRELTEPGHPAHDWVEWDDATAARAFRVLQVKRIMDSLRQGNGPAFVEVPTFVDSGGRCA